MRISELDAFKKTNPDLVQLPYCTLISIERNWLV